MVCHRGRFCLRCWAGDPQAQIVVWNIRLPRVGSALLVGAALAAAGASYQALFRNPSGVARYPGGLCGRGAGGGGGNFPVAAGGDDPGLGLCRRHGGGGAGHAGRRVVRGTDRTLTLVLLGVVVGALAGAATSLLKVMADPYDQLPAITFWLLGSLASITTRDILPALPVVLIGLMPLALLRWRINVLSLGDEEARALGIEAGRTRFIVIVAATLITASVTALAGVVGWVGLVIPHIARMLVGPGFGRLLPASALIGAGYLLVVDTLARTIAAVEVPLGVLTAVIGAPFFVWLLARGRRGWS